MDGCELLRKDRSERRGGGVTLYVREQLENIKLYPGTNKQVESLWMRIKGQANMGDTVLGVQYRPPKQEEEVNETLFLKSPTDAPGDAPSAPDWKKNM